jgi:hypothetical protein
MAPIHFQNANDFSPFLVIEPCEIAKKLQHYLLFLLEDKFFPFCVFVAIATRSNLINHVNKS